MLSDPPFPANSMAHPFESPSRYPLRPITLNPSSETSYGLTENDLVQLPLPSPGVPLGDDHNNLHSQAQVTANNSDSPSFVPTWFNYFSHAVLASQPRTLSFDLDDLEDATEQPGGVTTDDSLVPTPAPNNSSLLVSCDSSPFSTPPNSPSPAHARAHFNCSLPFDALGSPVETPNMSHMWLSASQPATSTSTPSTVAPAFIRHATAPGLHFSPQTSARTTTVGDLSAPGGNNTSSLQPRNSVQSGSDGGQFLHYAFGPHYDLSAPLLPYDDSEAPDAEFYDYSGIGISDMDHQASADETEVEDSVWDDKSETIEPWSPGRAPSPHPSQCSDSSHGSVAYATLNPFETPIGSPAQVQVYESLYFPCPSPDLGNGGAYDPSSSKPASEVGEDEENDQDDEYIPATSLRLSDDVVVPDPSLRPPPAGNTQKRTFKVALWEVINNPAYEEYIHWSEDGSIGIIEDKRDFEGSPAMKAITDARDIGGFVRQLNMWGFPRFRAPGGSEHSIAFSNKKWRRGRTDLMEEICRKGEQKHSRAANARRKKSKQGKKSQVKEAVAAPVATGGRKPRATKTSPPSDAKATKTSGVKRKRGESNLESASTDQPSNNAGENSSKQRHKSASTALAPRRWSNRTRTSNVNYRQTSEVADDDPSIVNPPSTSTSIRTTQGSSKPEADRGGPSSGSQHAPPAPKKRGRPPKSKNAADSAGQADNKPKGTKRAKSSPAGVSK